MKMQISITDNIYKSFRRKGNLWIADVNALMTIGMESLRVHAIEDAAEQYQKQKKRRFHAIKQTKDFESAAELADRFARKFLGNETYHLTHNSSNLHHFIEATKQIRIYAKALKVAESRMRTYLFNALASEYADYGKPIRAGHLSSENTWKVLMPQYLRNIMPGLGSNERKDNSAH